MLRLIALLFIVVGLNDVLASPTQVLLEVPKGPRQLHGRFLQITDMHPDPYYVEHTAKKTACHRKKGRTSKNQASYYGTPFSDCDSPFTLTNFTLDYLDKQWASEVDFVIWTGDNARHDNDPKVPRTPDEIYGLNRAMTAKMKEVFTSKGIPVVPSLGPNSITNEFAKIWETFVPFPYLQVFQRGAYYSKEVIPDKVAAISLNTMYFYDSNKAVGGCGFHDRDDPGNLQLDWLEVQLKTYRYRNMQFSFLEAIDLDFTKDKSDMEGRSNFRDKTLLYNILLQEFAALPTDPNKLDYADYAVVNTAPPVVPNPYMPSFRIFAYNVTGMESKPKVNKDRQHGHWRGDRHDKDAYCRSKKNQETWKCFLNETWNSDPESPSRSNKLWSPLGYAQYYLPDLEAANAKHKPKFKLEYLTFAPEQLHPPENSTGRKFHYPIPLVQLPKSLQDSGVTESKFAPYMMADLTIGSWVELAQRLGDRQEKKLRGRFRKYMYMGSE
ncbi:hypothetical protein H0H87_009061 [Tephrocybe sp. NHM501043]|nr:hypothetical protein H0H87_009061 [Tephrocybe sp. NHM501043]